VVGCGCIYSINDKKKENKTKTKQKGRLNNKKTMITKTIEVKLYTFDELSDEVKEKVLDEYRYVNVDYDGWYDFVVEDWEEKLEKLGYEDVKIYFSGFYSQGDGACFVAKVNIPKWIKAHKAGKRFRRLLKEYNEGWDASITIKHNYRYYFSTSTDVEYEGYWDLSDKAYEQLEEMAKCIEDEREKLGDEIYEDLAKEYEYMISDEAVAETIIANDYNFMEDGGRRICVG
jgi:hypothetical protein